MGVIFKDRRKGNTEAVIKKIQDHRGLPYPCFPQSFFLDNVVYIMV